MFTGIIKSIGVLKKTVLKDGNLRVVITCKDIPKDLKTGDSINIDGICSTITRIKYPDFEVDYMPETQRKTTIKNWKEGDKVNIEPALTLLDKINGHFVAGHVDCVSKIIKFHKIHGNIELDIALPKELSKFVALKGSITVDGISFTVSYLDDNFFRISLIPYTLKNTTLGNKKENDKVNIEADLLSRYLLRLFDERDNQTSYEFLKERGFI
ncbi:riboflavin synthase [Candidatus Peregrinibacteria bacterium]|nr:riboflavin synthase [Candidatus Peregrinibacteria bacterium]